MGLKWLDGRHMTHVVDRWKKDRTTLLQYAFFNAIGFESWENVWGVWMGLTERDGEALRRIATLLRWLGRERFTQGYASWEPYTPDLRREPAKPFSHGGPLASKFVRDDGDCAWLIINRSPEPAVAEISVSRCLTKTRKLFDLYRGQPLLSASGTLFLKLEPNGYGALLSTKSFGPVQSLIEKMQKLTAKPLSSYNASWAPLPQKMVGMQSAVAVIATPPLGMVLIPRTTYRFRTAGVQIEGGCNTTNDTWGICCKKSQMLPRCPALPNCKTPCSFSDEDTRGGDFQFPWESSAGRFHDHVIEIGPFYIDRDLVTRGDYSKYLQESGYRPSNVFNFLLGWNSTTNGSFAPPSGTDRWPVTSVSLAEARAYCSWADKRLPHAYEWQLAAQGTDGRTFPWGNLSGKPGVHFPKPSNGRTVPPLPNVGSYSPAGDSVYGMRDIVGFVWQYTDEFRDEHTRSVLLKGSSIYTPMLSDQFPSIMQPGNWYFPKAPQIDRHNRMLLMSDSYERATTLGFRCVADHREGSPAPFHYTASDRGAPALLFI